MLPVFILGYEVRKISKIFLMNDAIEYFYAGCLKIPSSTLFPTSLHTTGITMI